MAKTKKLTSTMPLVYLAGFLMGALLLFTTGRDSCANSAYANYAGVSDCPSSKVKP